MWKCPKCEVENGDDSASCSACQEPRPVETATASTTPTSTEWHYSGKALRGRNLLSCLCTLLLIVTGVCVTYYEWMPNYLTILWWGIGLIVAGIWVHFLCVYWYRTCTITYRLTEHRFEIVQGIFTRSTDPIELLYISDLKLEIRLWDRIINGGVGTITLYSTTDKTDSVLKIGGLENPQAVYDLIDSTRAKVRAQRGFIST